MAWNAIVVIVTACVTLIVLREGVRITLIHELDQLLREDLREIEIALSAHEVTSVLYEQLNRKDLGHERHNWFAELSGPDGVSFRSTHAPPPSVWNSDGNRPAQSTKGWRLLSHTVPGSGITIRVGASLALIHEDIARLDRFVGLAACGMLVIAPLCGYWLAGRATRPLAQIIATTARLRPSQLNDRLEVRGTGDELDQLSTTMNRLLDRIGKHLQERRNFLANAAHELRTPLAAIHSSIEVTLAGNRTNGEYRQLLAEILEESGSLELLVNQLLLLSETETERLKVDKGQLRFDELVRKSVDMFEGVAEYREIALVCSSLPVAVVEGNHQHLRQVICNLLDNALKFTPSGGRVKVELTIDQATDTLVFTVEDSGAGIPADDIPHIFERFFQGNRMRSGTPEKRGTGLGLSICHAIIQAHDGTIDVHSRVGEGTRFTVRLPVWNVDEGSPGPLTAYRPPVATGS